jgi:anthranilate/para-aminobenzoate synthase component I
LKITEFNINQEGFAVLHGKWDGRTIVGINGRQITEGEIREFRLHGTLIGYLAYPNPTLKNKIPNSKFYKYQEVLHPKSPPIIDANFQTFGRLEQSVTKSEYIKKILQVKELLAAGEIYQLNYAIRFRKKFKGSPYALFLKLVDANPTDFSVYLNCGDFQIISSSPERLLKVQNNKIITQPIKGTADKRSLKYLLNSEKERAELDMITDLERNDVGKICKYGTLKLTKERELLEMKNIWHTYSEVEGKLWSDVGFDEIISAMFPGGSITGCPKKRAMEYIEKLEGMPRNIFTGSIGYISNCGAVPPGRDVGLASPWGHFIVDEYNNSLNNSPHATKGAAPRDERSCPTRRKELPHNCKMDFNIAIRTALVRNGYIEYWAGGGIVADSKPEKEYEECLLKAEKFLELL